MKPGRQHGALGRCVWWFVSRLAGMGSIWMAAEWSAIVHQGPPEGHPERLRTDLPLTATERALRKELPRELRGTRDPFS